MRRLLWLPLLALFCSSAQAQHDLYVGIADLGLTVEQRTTLIEGLKLLGRKNDSPFPHLRNHWRVNLAQDSIILEAEFEDSTITAEAIKTRLVSLFGVAPSSITYVTTQSEYGPVVTFRHNSVNKLRLIAFGGLDATREESRQAVIAYLRDNAADWEEPAP